MSKHGNSQLIGLLRSGITIHDHLVNPHAHNKNEYK